MDGHLSKFCMFSVVLLIGCTSVSEPMVPLAEPPAHNRSREWEKVTYKQIGLAIELPNWNADIEDYSNLWVLLGFPLVDNPVAGTQYGISIQIRRMAEKSFRLSRAEDKSFKTDLQTWINLSHRVTSQQSDPYWIYIRRDIFCDDGFVYTIYAKIKRVGEKWEFNVKDRIEDYKIIADEAKRVIDSIIPLNETQDP